VYLHDGDMATSGFLRHVASGPTGHLSPGQRRERRELLRTRRAQADESAKGPATLLVYRDQFPHQLTGRSNRRWWRVISQLLAPLLDHQLAEGRSPESRVLLAARAHVLVSPAKRQALAWHWDDLMDRARTPPVVRGPRVPINRDAIRASEHEIGTMLDALVAPVPTPARGVAMVSWLLTDGAGPVYNTQTSSALREEILEATALLGPGTT
jgi:hypothetical protein